MRVAAYARFSSDNQRVESIDAQLRAIRQYCSDNDFMIVKTYADEAVSGTSDQRDQFLQMIKDAKKNMFDIVVVHKLDRFARNRYDSAIYRKELKDANVKLISVLERVDEENPENIILLSVLEGMNEYYSKNLAREVRKGQKENALKGIHNGGVPPLGFKVDPETRKLIINEEEAEAVRIIFSMYTKKYGYDLICQELNKKGYKTRSGRKFTRNSIADILRNEKYIGHYVFNKRLSKKSGNRKYKDEKDIIKIENAFPAIIDLSLWNKKEEILNSRLKPRKNASRQFLLTGKIFCSCCNGNYVGSSTWSGRNAKKYYQYESTNRKRKINNCKNKPIRADLLEEFIVKKLKADILNDNIINDIAMQMLDIVTKNSKANSKILIELTKKQTVIQNRIDKLLDLFLDGGMSKNALESKTKSMQEELENITIRINELTSNQTKAPTLDKIKKYLNHMKENLDSTDIEEQQIAIDTFVKKIIVGVDSVEVQLIICPLAIDNNNNIFVLNADNVSGDGACLTLSTYTYKGDLIPKYKPINTED